MLVGDEGGFGPRLQSNEQAVELILRGDRRRPGYSRAATRPSRSTSPARTSIDDGRYHLQATAGALSADEMVDAADALGRRAIRSSASRTAWPRTTGTAGSC